MRHGFHAPRWDEPLVMELGAPGRRGAIVAAPGDEAGADLVPESMRRAAPPELPELSEHDVLRHYLHLAQETLGMLGVSLFGTCTVKYNPRVAEQLVTRPQVAEVHPYQDPATLQGLLEIVHRLDRILRELSGMDQFVFQPGGGANAAYTHACVTRAYHAARGELETRREVITTIQSHPCNPATAAAAGFDVITLPLEEHGYPSLEALKAVVSERTAALMVGNPDDMGIYNPHIREWVEVVHDAGALAFYDHANFNGVMGKLRARELGFDACMYMLHKTFGAPKTGGGGPATGAYGCSAELAPFLPVPLVGFDGERYTLEVDRPQSIGKIREFMGNLPVVVRAYAWARGMGADGIDEASDLSVLANNYMATRLTGIRGVTISHPHLDGPRMEMTRYSLEQLREETGVSVVDVANRMADFGIDGPWLSHHPWLVPEPITPEAGELWSREDLDEWCDVLEHVCGEAYADAELVRTAPHRSVIHQVDFSGGNDPDRWATTWRAYRRKHGVPSRAETVH
jgi:glycine dehydrogenase subunit 2